MIRQTAPVKVSVAVTTFNHERFIARAIRSVLEQESVFDFEIVVGEDCSNDETRQILIELAQERPDVIRLRLNETNLGARRNFVDTIQACRGEYVAVLDGDDYWTSPKKLQTAAQFLDEHQECSICFHSVLLLYEDGDAVPYYPPRRQSTYSMESLLQSNFIMSCSPMVRRGYFDDFPRWSYDNPDSPGDWLYLIMNAAKGRIGYIDEIMGGYRLHGDGVWTSKDRVSRLRSTIRMFDCLDRELNFEYKDSIARSKFRMHLKIACARFFPFAIRPFLSIRKRYRLFSDDSNGRDTTRRATGA